MVINLYGSCLKDKLLLLFHITVEIQGISEELENISQTGWLFITWLASFLLTQPLWCCSSDHKRASCWQIYSSKHVSRFSVEEDVDLIFDSNTRISCCLNSTSVYLAKINPRHISKRSTRSISLMNSIRCNVLHFCVNHSFWQHRNLIVSHLR